jgi:hypothetical protein
LSFDSSFVWIIWVLVVHASRDLLHVRSGQRLVGALLVWVLLANIFETAPAEFDHPQARVTKTVMCTFID